MSEKDLWKTIGKMAEAGMPVATYVLHGSSVPVFSILEENDEIKAVIICTPEYVERIKKELGVK